MEDLNERDLKVARQLALKYGSDMIHALGCRDCGLREESLFVLGIMGWSEESFLADYFAWLRRAR
jgi:hypothetical protein